MKVARNILGRLAHEPLGQTLLGTALVTITSAAASAQSFVWIGPQTVPSAVSADGRTVVGRSPNVGRPFIWSRASGMQYIDICTTGRATDVNADGSVVVGYCHNRAFRWTSTGGLQDLGHPPGEWYATYPYAVSADGNVVVGGNVTTGARERPFRWTAATGMEELPTLPGWNYSSANSVSADGSIIVGDVLGDAYPVAYGFRWTLAGGMEQLSNPAGWSQAICIDISADGSTIVGSGIPSDGRSHPLRWTASNGWEDLGIPAGMWSSGAGSVNGDGSVILGTGRLNATTTTTHAVVWHAETGWVDLNAYLASIGFNLNGWTLTSAIDVSADGLTIVGRSDSPDGSEHGWILSLAECPGDFDHNLQVNSQDFFDYLTAFFAGDAAADFNADGTVNSGDFFAFLEAFLAGCP